MKNPARTLSATSVQRAPQDEAASRIKRYALTMGIRTACFIAMALIQPFGWYTWVLGAGAIFLPYLAVVMANTGKVEAPTQVETPTRSLGSSPTEVPQPEAPSVIQITETRGEDQTR